ncbi:MAG: hypothetical protein AMJ42_01515 [Deltaproteobacteria bacterium DG_8]|nr:MAG: hypothetical protein AMJ42_01515 [Deltaproteobacteria bacterium DG_8]
MEQELKKSVSIIMPVYNEEESLRSVLNEIKQCLKERAPSYEIIVVNDGSADQTKQVLEQIGEIKVVNHSENRGYGAAIKSGVRQAEGEYILIIDADGTYPVKAIPELISCTDYHMVVGARTKPTAQIPLMRRPAKWLLNQLANYLTGIKIPDLNSGLRLIKKDVLNRFIYLLPDGFSFTTTITLALLTNGCPVKYLPIDYYKREGKSKFRPIKDTLNYFQLIIRTILYFDPLKIFLPVGLVLFLLSFAVLFYSYFFTPKVMDITTIILFISAIQILAIGVLADLVVKSKNK